MASRESIRAYAERAWEEVAEAKLRHWSAEKERHGPAHLLRVAEALREEVRALRPDWPSKRERSADLATHARVSRSLALAAPLRRR
jgi:hypothetical protein